jgi:hypothetical protein
MLELTTWWLVVNLVLADGGHESRYVRSFANEAACWQTLTAMASETRDAATCEGVRTYKLYRGPQSAA